MKFKYVEGMIENVDYVECPICHKRVRMITEKHTKLVHNLTKEYAENVSRGYYRCKYVSSHGKIYYLKSSYELRICRFLDRNNIDFEYEFKGFEYVYDNSRHTYYPDFYLKDYGLVLEVKPEKFITDDLVLAKFNVVKDLGYNIIFITEDEVFSESNFLDTIQTSTTNLKQ